MNLVILKGRLTKSPTLLFGKSGTAYTSINIAVDRYSKDKNSNADFINCTAFGKTAELIAEYFRKGQEILLRGNIKTETLEKEGSKVYKQSVFVENVEFVGSKKENTETKEEETQTQDNEEFPW